jgi:hypothetical protein
MMVRKYPSIEETAAAMSMARNASDATPLMESPSMLPMTMTVPIYRPRI